MKRIVPLVLVLLIPACRGGARAQSSPDRDAVLAVAERYRRAWLNGDTAMALGVVSDDIRIMIHGVPDVRGRAGARALFVQEMSTWRIPTLRINRQELTLAGDHAIDLGTYEETMVPRSGVPIHAAGRYLTIWRREGGEWRLWRFMLNDPQPAPAAAQR